jgi:hypothetical protein
MLQFGVFVRHGIKIVMWALIAEMLACPLADTHPRAGALIGFGVLMMVFAGSRYFANRTLIREVVFPIAATWVIARLIEAFGNPYEAYANLSPVAGLVFSCSILWAIFDHFRSDFRNPRNAITEAFISYLIIATAYSQLYWILNRFMDHAFNQVIPSTQSATFLYFSMISLTSVGYGGIVPLNPYVRLVAATETMAGIFFVAVVVARLVASYRPTVERQRHSAAYNADDSMKHCCECEWMEPVMVVASYEEHIAGAVRN